MNGLNGRVDGLEMKKGKWEKDVRYLTRWAKGPANFLLFPIISYYSFFGGPFNNSG